MHRTYRISDLPLADLEEAKVPEPIVEGLAPLVEEARRRGYLSVDGDRIIYHGRRDRRYNFRDPEEKVRAFTFSWLIIERSYSPKRMDLEVTVPRRTPNDWADIVVYEDDACRTPYLIVENK